MKLKKLEICGFKSFVDRTVVRFERDVTAVVGPNGCGKSNILDAIRWTMGEQSAKQLRGKAMDDVIFNGSAARGAHSFAEVTLTFENDDGKLPPEYREYSEIAITRKLTRSGDSSYLINKAPVRLMDITGLFLGTGVGARAYSIIEQGRIGQVVTSRPEERRGLIEEAAGITKFKRDKRTAERKIERVRQNLLRINDIIGELEKSLASLKRQAQKAERYRRYRDECRDLDLWVSSHKYLELHGQIQVLRARRTESEAQLERARLSLTNAEGEIELERIALGEKEARVQVLSGEAHGLAETVKLLESQLSHHGMTLAELRRAEHQAEEDLSEARGRDAGLQEEHERLEEGLEEAVRIERDESSVLQREQQVLDERRSAALEAERAVSAGRSRLGDARTRIVRAETHQSGFDARRGECHTRIEKLAAEREDLRLRLEDLAGELNEVQARRDGLSAGKVDSAARKDELEQALSGLRSQAVTAEQSVEKLRSELAERSSRLRSVEQIQRRFEGVGAGVRALMNQARSGQLQGVRGLLSDRLRCPEELTQALAGVLGERLQYVVVDGEQTALSALEMLREKGRGRAGVIPGSPLGWVEPEAPVALEAASGLEDLRGEGLRGALLDLVDYDEQDVELVRGMLQGVLVVEDLEAARRWRDRLRDGSPRGVCRCIVTLAGDVLGADGHFTGGQGDDAGAHMLDLQREVRSLTPLVERLTEALAQAQSGAGELRTSISGTQAALDAARSDGHQNEIALVTAEKDLRGIEGDISRTQSRVEALAYEGEELEQKLIDAAEEEGALKGELEEARRAVDESERSLAGFEQVHGQRREAVDAQHAIVTSVQVRAASARQRLQSERSALDRVVGDISDLAARVARLESELHKNVGRQGQTAAEIFRDRDELDRQITSTEQAQRALSEASERYEAAKCELTDRDAVLRELRGEIDQHASDANEAGLAEQRVEMSTQHLLEQVDSRYRVDLRTVLNEHHNREIAGEAVHERVAELGRLIERMGSINLEAIEEFERESERHAEMTRQRDDLVVTCDGLEQAIQKMNRESRKLFRATFTEVAALFAKLFPIMFGGGKGELCLTDPQDLLETGIEIKAQPPGKRLASIDLMSGGEKALTAVALVFAIFQYKPSPFCVLDEVDAPLDEANIGRFADAIRGMTGKSQFIVITHAKRTMEMADVLYGVTMAQPGISKLVNVELTRQSESATEGRGGARVA